jgi:hypothetical protein
MLHFEKIKSGLLMKSTEGALTINGPKKMERTNVVLYEIKAKCLPYSFIHRTISFSWHKNNSSKEYA